MIQLHAAGLTDVGQVREGNEDAMHVGDSVFAVADGMGGHAAGEVASSLALEPIAELDATSPDWPVKDAEFDIVLMSYISGSVPEAIIAALYTNAYKALKPGGRLLVHDFMVNDSLDSPALGALWALQHVTVNADGLGLCPAEIIDRASAAGFGKCETMEMIHGMTKLIVCHKP